MARRVLVYDKVGRPLGELDAEATVRSWNLNAVGEMDLTLPLDSSKVEWGLIKPGHHIAVLSDRVDLWAGVMSAPELGLEFERDYLLIRCYSGESHLRGRVMDVDVIFQEKTWADIVIYMVERLRGYYGVPVELGNIEAAAPIRKNKASVGFHLDYMADVIERSVRGRGFEYRWEPVIDEDNRLKFKFHFLESIGADKSKEFALIEGFNLSKEIRIWAEGNLATETYAHSETERWWLKEEHYAKQRSEEHAGLYGVWDEVLVNAGDNLEGIVSTAENALREKKDIIWHLDMGVLDANGSWSKFQTGDIVGVQLVSYGLTPAGKGLNLRYRITGRALDEEQGEMRIQGETVEAGLSVDLMMRQLGMI